MTVYDAIIVGGGPAGSSCAYRLARAGARVAILDRAQFPRVKLCAGWLSAPIWDALELQPREYTAGLWPWETCHVHFKGAAHQVRCRGWFIRRYEFDDFLLQRARAAGAEVHLGESVKSIVRNPDGLWEVAGRQARTLVGAGGTHCPVARVLAPPRPRGVVGVQELEFQADPGAIARTRIGGDGEPELLLHDDLRGYSWNVPKTDWLNVGCGTVDPGDVRAAWRRAADHFRDAGHLPEGADETLEHVKGHSYYLFDPAHLEGAASAAHPGAYLVGDSLGLAQPLTAEGILPAVLSGRLCGEAVLAGEGPSYPRRLAEHPVMADYRRVFALRELGTSLRKRQNGDGAAAPTRASRAARLADRAVAKGFAWMFSGARLPAPRVVDLLVAGALKLGGDRHGQPRA